MDGIQTMKPLWMIMALNMLLQLVVRAENPLSLFLSPNPTSSLSPSPLSYHPLYVDSKIPPKTPKIPKIHLPVKLFLFQFCVHECHRTVRGARPNRIYLLLMAICVATKCRPSHLDVVSPCALGCMAITTNSRYGIKFLTSLTLIIHVNYH